MSAEILQELRGFLYRDDVSRSSSCRSVSVQGEETAVRYWHDTIKGLVNHYLLEFPNGWIYVIYTHLPTNFRMNTMLARLCNICDDFGYFNFDDLCTFINEICSLCSGANGSMLIKNVRCYETFLKTKFSKLAQKHSPCLELCQTHAFASCSEQHQAVSSDILVTHNVHSSLTQSIESPSDESTKSDLHARLQEFFKVIALSLPGTFITNKASRTLL